jgi:hypothetical protein
VINNEIRSIMNIKYIKIIALIIFLALGLAIFFYITDRIAGGGRIFLSQETKQCIECHEKEHIQTAQIEEWRKSEHAKKGIGCYECHHANKSEPDAFECNGFIISKIVSPIDCADCHKQEFEEFDQSHHAKAGEILGSLDNYLGEVVQGSGSSIQGCQACHGSLVKVNEDGELDYKTWPNVGVGRLNPDGSKGSCSTCHSKHNFSLEVARSPESCGKCHLGPDHPQKEIYQESIHGRLFFVKTKEMNLDSSEWILGKDYTVAPNCVTCHAGTTKDLPGTHDYGTRLSYNLRQFVSDPMEDSEIKRERMKKVCINCHGPEWINNFYKQFDNTIALFNDYYAKPALEIMNNLKEKNKITSTPFDDEIEWVYFELWHHEGRRARHGAAMMGPDYVQWEGFYEVAHKFYFEFLPLAKELGEEEYVNNLLSQPEHSWIKGVDPDSLEDQAKAFAQWREKRKELMNMSQ